jgi:hypothetical protein
MYITRGERLAPVLALGAAAAVIPGLSELAFGHTSVSIPPVIHFYAVGMTALATAVASLVLTGIGELLAGESPTPAAPVEQPAAAHSSIPTPAW